MPAPDELTIHAAPHPNAQVCQVGFELGHPYVEQVSAGIIGPTSVLLLRRLPLLWRQQEPARVQAGELARSLGLGSHTTSSPSRLWRTIERLRQFGFARQGPDGAVEVFAQVPALTPRQVARLPEWSQEAHHRLLGQHLDRLAGTASPSTTVPAPDLGARLDRLEYPRAAAAPGLAR